ncbi:MAG: polysaccharide deacetylase family protein [Nitrospiraceae bacterium]
MLRPRRQIFFAALRAALPLALLLALVPSSAAQVITSGPRTCPGVALTFDLCPVRNPVGYDEALVSYLKDNKIPATFFISGRWATKHQDRVKDLQTIPYFELGTHGDVHAHLPMHDEAEQREEIDRATRLMQRQFGVAAPLFRPPFGEYNDLTVQVVKALGLQFILWDVVSGDPDPTLSAVNIIERVTKRVRPGSIVVMHANGKGKHTRELVQALHERILEQKRLRPMTVSELLDCREKRP